MTPQLSAVAVGIGEKWKVEAGGLSGLANSIIILSALQMHLATSVVLQRAMGKGCPPWENRAVLTNI